MDAKLKAKWVKALCSGDYPQGRVALRSLDGKYCCLGVLCAVGEGSTNIDRNYFMDDSDLKKFRLDATEQGALASVNDHGVPFDMIAGLIDEAL